MKHHGAPVNPNLILDHSSIILSKNAVCSTEKRQKRIYQDNQKSTTFTSLQCCSKLVEVATTQTDSMVKYLENMISVKFTSNK